MCGSTDAQNTLQDEQLAAYQQAQDMTREMYADQKAIYAPMEKQFQSIFALGPNQQGFNDQERNTLNAQAVEGTARNYAAASKAVGESLAAEGGGNADISMGGQQQLREQVAASAAGQQSQQETQIQEADYEAGFQDWLRAGQGLQTIAAGESPTSYENAATGAGSAAGTTANQIAQENNSWINAALGAAGGLGSAVIAQNPGDIFGCWIAAELYGGWGDPRVLRLRAWIFAPAAGQLRRRAARLYVRFGQTIAERIKSHRAERWLCKLLFDWLLRKAANNAR